MARWLIYSKERFPFVTYLLINAGISLSAAALFANSKEELFTIRNAMSFALSLLGLFLFFFQLRLMDECKDFEKDKIANPKRPLARGLIKVTEAARVIWILHLFMLIFTLSLWYFSQTAASVAYFVTTVWLFLMYKEFFVSKWLCSRPLLYAFSHQVICIPLSIFAVLLFHPQPLNDVFGLRRAFLFGVCIMGGFFTYEVGRKLNPLASPVLGTYFVAFGYKYTGIILTIISALGAAFSVLIEPRTGAVQVFLAFLIMISYWKFMSQKNSDTRYKIVEILASSFLVTQIWATFLSRFFSL